MQERDLRRFSSFVSSRRELLLLGSALLATACNKSTPQGGAGESPAVSDVPRFAFVTNNTGQFWNIAEKGLRKAEKELGIKADIFKPLKGEVADQQRFLEDILVQKYDGVAISPINPDAMTQILDKVAAVIPVVCHDSDASKSKRKTYVGTNNVIAGKAAGDAAKAALAAANVTKGKIALFVGRIDMQNAIERRQGVQETLGQLPGFEILPVFLDGTDRTKAKKNVEDALARYPDLEMCIGLWSYNGPCIVGAVSESTRAKKPLIIAFDEEEDTLQAVHDGKIAATIVQKPFEFGYQSMRILKEAKAGKPVPSVIDTGIVTVQKDNLPKFWAELKQLSQK